MFNDFSGFDADGKTVKISVPPTLLISSIGVHPDVGKAVSMDAKLEGDLVYSVGSASTDMGGSEYFMLNGITGYAVPGLDIPEARERYEKISACIEKGLLASAFPVAHGGLLTALAKVAIAGKMGIDVTISPDTRPDYYLFSESPGRFVVTVAPGNQERFEKIMGSDAALLGRTGGGALRVSAANTILDIPVHEIDAAYRAPFGGY
jgi:phosphoribosylformylglycinamidine synthase subunit PurSL